MNLFPIQEKIIKRPEPNIPSLKQPEKVNEDEEIKKWQEAKQKEADKEDELTPIKPAIQTGLGSTKNIGGVIKDIISIPDDKNKYLNSASRDFMDVSHIYMKLPLEQTLLQKYGGFTLYATVFFLLAYYS